jgi:hypothetical protein
VQREEWRRRGMAIKGKNKRYGNPIREKEIKIGKGEERKKEIILHAIFDASCSSSSIKQENSEGHHENESIMAKWRPILVQVCM